MIYVGYVDNVASSGDGSSWESPYNDINVAISGILASGIGVKNEYFLYVSSDYSGIINSNIHIPNSGLLSIICGESIFGSKYTSAIDGNLRVTADNVNFQSIMLDSINGNVNISGSNAVAAIVRNCDIRGYLNVIGELDIIDSTIDTLNNQVGIYSSYLDLQNSNLIGNNIICSGEFVASSNSCYSNGDLAIRGRKIESEFDLFYGCVSGINGINLYVRNDTFDCTNAIYNTSYLQIDNSIIDSTSSFTGSGSGVISNSIINGIASGPTINYSNTNTSTNLFNNKGVHDYRLVSTSDAIGFGTKLSVDDTVVETSVARFTILDDFNKDASLSFVNGSWLTSDMILKKGEELYSFLSGKLKYLDKREYIGFLNQTKNTVYFSSHNRELQAINFLDSYNETKLYYTLGWSTIFSTENVRLKSTFENYVLPYDWIHKEFIDPSISKNNKYIIPMSYVNIYDIMKSKINAAVGSVNLGRSFSKEAIEIYQKPVYRGVTYDYYSSRFGESIVWVLDAINQLLVKKDFISGEILEEYPINCKKKTSSYIKPSGLIPLNQVENGYEYYDSYTEQNIIGINANYDFFWLDTSIDTTKDFRGIRSYESELYISYLDFGIEKYNFVDLSNSGIGKILQIPSDSTFDKFCNSEGLDHVLISGSNPMDITFNSLGNMIVADYTSNRFNVYKLCYDYALVQNSQSDGQATIILRENYSDVSVG